MVFKFLYGRNIKIKVFIWAKYKNKGFYGWNTKKIIIIYIYCVINVNGWGVYR